MKWIAAVMVLALTHVGTYFAGHLNGVGGALTARPDAGRFLSDATLTQLDGELWAVKGDFVYVDPDGKPWLAPDGSKVNGASIPSALWQVVGPPLRGAYVKASIVHDVACEEQSEPSAAVHRMFYYACLAGGLPEPRARMMYWGVQTFGPTWGAAEAHPAEPLASEPLAAEAADASSEAGSAKARLAAATASPRVAAQSAGMKKRTFGTFSSNTTKRFSTPKAWSTPAPTTSAPPPAAAPSANDPPPELTPAAARRALAYFESHNDLPLPTIANLGAKPLGE